MEINPREVQKDSVDVVSVLLDIMQQHSLKETSKLCICSILILVLTTTAMETDKVDMTTAALIKSAKSSEV